MGVSEVIYPTDFDVQSKGETNRVIELAEQGITPQDFATREVGVIMNVLPEISPSGDSINLTLKPASVEPPIWKDYGYDQQVGRKPVHRPMEQPIFHVYTCETQLSVENGKPTLALRWCSFA